MTANGSERAFVLGLDGVPWSLVERWAKAGALPNFAELIENGAAGPLDSTRPANTALAWPSIATGVRPDKHGVYCFRRLLPEYRHRLNTSANVDRSELWDMVSPSIVANVPMTYPATAIDGTAVTGMLTPELNDRFTYPPAFGEELRERIPDYRIGLDWNEYRDRPAEFRPAFASLFDARRRLMDLLMEREDWRLFFFVYTEPDRLQHLLWDETVLLDFYTDLDDVLGDVLAYAADQDATVYIVSDHGFAPIEKYVYVNTVLREAGYLVPREETGARSTLSRLGVDKSKILGLLDRFGIDEDLLVEYLPRSVVERVADRIPGDHALHDVDYTRTRAFVHGQGNVYVNDAERFASGPVDPADRAALKGELADVFSALRDPETGEQALIVHDGDDCFPTDDGSPDLVVEPAEGYKPSLGLTDSAFVSEGVHAADHHREGIFLAYGPDVAPGSTPENASVVDVAPTVLHGLRQAIPHDADGRVLGEIFAEDSVPAERPVERREYASKATRAEDVEEDEGDFEGVEERLKGLGYLE